MDDSTLQALALLLTGVVHLVGAAVLVWAIAGDDVQWKKVLRPGDGDGGVGPRPRGPADRSDGGQPLGLGDAEQSTLRLRERGRLADARRAERPARRPAEIPAAPEPQRDPVAPTA